MILEIKYIRYWDHGKRSTDHGMAWFNTAGILKRVVRTKEFTPTFRIVFLGKYLFIIPMVTDVSVFMFIGMLAVEPGVFVCSNDPHDRSYVIFKILLCYYSKYVFE